MLELPATPEASEAPAVLPTSQSPCQLVLPESWRLHIRYLNVCKYIKLEMQLPYYAVQAQATFPDRPYVSMETLDTRDFARSDPRGFLGQYAGGAIFETWVIAEIYKACVHRGVQPGLFHYRETRGLEIDLLIEQGERLDAIEIKSSATASPDFFENLQRFADRLADAGEARRIESYVVYGGDDFQQRSHAQLVSWRDVHRIAAHS